MGTMTQMICKIKVLMMGMKMRVLLFLLFLRFLVILLLLPFISLIILLLFVKKREQRKQEQYKQGSYYQTTKRSYASVRNDKGAYGEYLTYKNLEHLEANGARFLFNVYIPKGDGDTTEIDLLMICPKGIFVFESKNYSGWIFGSEEQKNWCQTLTTGRGRGKKFYFYNPILQNRVHIKYLKNFLSDSIPLHSIVVFSDRCTLKSITVTSNDVNIIKRHDVKSTVSEICNRTGNVFLSKMDIVEIYNRLYSFSQVGEVKKEQHIENICSHINKQSMQNGAFVETNSVEKISKNIDDKIVTYGIDSCPRCGGRLVLRTATQGAYKGRTFYGCSNYPYCRYIQNIDK